MWSSVQDWGSQGSLGSKSLKVGHVLGLLGCSVANHELFSQRQIFNGVKLDQVPIYCLVLEILFFS